MPKIQYRKLRFHAKVKVVIEHAARFLQDMQQQGYAVTLRSLYYHFVAHDLFAEDRKFTWTGTKWVKDPKGTKNAEPNYKMLIDIIGNARLAGLLDWRLIVDRTRNLMRLSSWMNPQDIIDSCVASYRRDLWADQPNYVEVWIEKDAQVGIIEGTCQELRVPYFSCRGYTSLSEIWHAAQRLKDIRDIDGKDIHIVHLGDHDPSGCDMSRDIFARLEEFSGGEISLHREALTMAQIKKYNPPPNPAKLTDSRSGEYVRKYGDDSWEMDALPAKVTNDIIRKKVAKLRDDKIWDASLEVEETHKDELKIVAFNWPGAVKGAKKKPARRKKSTTQKK